MSEITLVTAFFDIGREEWKGFSRGRNKYLDYFAHWARLRNPIVVYTDSRMAESVLSVRKKFGLQDRTHVIVIDEVEAVAPDCYDVIKKTMSNRESWMFRRYLDHPESWNYKYNYVTGLKTFWVQDAVTRNLCGDTAAWIDFGYDHGGMDFPFSEDFDFLWSYDFEPGIHLFLVKEMDDKPIFAIVRDMDTYISGGIIVGQSRLWKDLWRDTKRAIYSLADCGMADDDQTLLLMAYRQHPELYHTHMMSFWGESLRGYGGNSLRLRPLQRKRFDSLHQLHRKFRAYKNAKWKIWHEKQLIWRRHGKEIEKKYFNVK